MFSVEILAGDKISFSPVTAPLRDHVFLSGFKCKIMVIISHYECNVHFFFFFFFFFFFSHQTSL